jgi:hypothetical protein
LEFTPHPVIKKLIFVIGCFQSSGEEDMKENLPLPHYGLMGNVTCSLVGEYRRFGGKCYLHLIIIIMD